MAGKKQDLGEILAKSAEAPAKGPEQPEKSSLGQVLYQALGKAWDGAIPLAEHGAAELTSAIYTGNAYVPYGWSQAEPGNEQKIEAPNTPEAKEVDKDVGLER